MNYTHVITYTRVSTADQKSGRDTQLDVINKKIVELGYRHIIENFTDEDVSGDSHIDERPGFKKMLQFIKEYKTNNPSNPIREIWTQTRDRISRDVDMLGYATVILKTNGIEIRSIEDAQEGLVKRIHDMLGEEELKKYRQKRMHGVKRRIQEKKVMSRAPIGYKVEKGKLVIDPELKPMMIEIFQMFEDGVTMSTISNKFSIPRSTLAHIRKNPIYRTGEYSWKGKVIYYVEPIIKEGDIIKKEEDLFYH